MRLGDDEDTLPVLEPGDDDADDGEGEFEDTDEDEDVDPDGFNPQELPEDTLYSYESADRDDELKQFE